jgi:hypothetical protein
MCISFGAETSELLERSEISFDFRGLVPCADQALEEARRGWQTRDIQSVGYSWEAHQLCGVLAGYVTPRRLCGLGTSSRFSLESGTNADLTCRRAG